MSSYSREIAQDEAKEREAIRAHISMLQTELVHEKTRREAAEAVVQIIRDFIKDQRIHCAETIFQSDRVIENACEFIEKLVERVGYHKEESA